MEIVAINKSVRMSPRKVRLVADLVKGVPVREALLQLSMVQKRARVVVEQAIKSAVANAQHNSKLSEDQLMVKNVKVYEGPSLKRFRPSTRGRVHPYKKRTSHIKVILEDSYGTKS